MAETVDTSAVLVALQHGDSFFPGGAISFSWGLEALRADGRVSDAATLGRFIEGQLRARWATSDRAALIAVYQSADDLDAVAAIDCKVEALSLAREQREGSRRAGAALLNAHDRLGTPGAGAYRQRVIASEAPGHLPVVQGLVWRGAGLTLDIATATAAHMLCVGFIGVAVRLGFVGAADGQRLLRDLRAVVVAVLEESAPAPDEMHGFAPATDIAMMRHETQITRLFAN
jgi:urease accessory protein